MCPTFFMHRPIKRKPVFFHNTIKGTLRYTNFSSNLSLSTCVCDKSSWLKTSVSTSSISAAVRAVRERPLPGKRFEVPVRSILRIILFKSSLPLFRPPLTQTQRGLQDHKRKFNKQNK